MYIWEQIQFEWISSKLEMGNPGLPDPRVVAPRLSLPPAHFHSDPPLPSSFPSTPLHAHSPCFHPSDRPPRSKRYFRRQIPPQQRETFLVLSSPPLCAYFSSFPATGEYIRCSSPSLCANRIRPTSRCLVDTTRHLPDPFPPLLFYILTVGKGRRLGTVVENVLRLDIVANRV